MSFDWTRFIDLSNELLRGTSDDLIEAYERTAISRSYYCAYNTARNEVISNRNDEKVLNKIKSKNKVGVHEALIRYYQSSKNPADRAIAGDLRALRDRRTQADYKVSSKIVNRANAELTIKEAEDLYLRLVC